MKKGCDFSKGERGKFYHPSALKKKQDAQTIVNELLRDHKELAKSA